ncbi:MAG TPA: hypothetical protein VGI19_01065 [Candidatus Cybelea sp.]
MKIFRRRAVMVVIVLLVAFIPALKARAGLDMALGPQKVVKNQPLSACNQAAKSALDATLGGAQELGGDSGEWQAYNAGDTANGSTAAAAIHCYPAEGGYVVTFTCAAQVPPSTDTASALCTKLSAAFDSKASAFGDAGQAPGGSL